ncbi:MAG: fimbrillin family protein [Dysgonamonadaceae bacterium]|nr:fimbrillin family protein [Dysgonamonadaceae bacterium]
MKRLSAHITGWIVLLAAFSACEQKELFLCPPTGNIPVNVVIHWDSVYPNPSSLPRDMTVHWYPSTGILMASDMDAYGGREWLNVDKYQVMCLDFHGNATLAFRSNGSREDFEVYNIRMTGLYNTQVPQLPEGEVTVAEAYPYRFYIDSRRQTIDLEQLPAGDTATVHFYPKDILREFTFLVYDVTGAKYMAKNGGAISGMSGSYFPASGKLASTPSTILFSRVEAIEDGQNSPRWTDEEKALFAARNPDWNSSDTLTGWTRDWVTGKFVTFGPLDRNSHRFRLTVEAVSPASNYYHGAWGYWHGQWENTVAAQIDSAMGKNGTPEEQLAWRRRNGGYDILLFNDNRLVVNDEEAPYNPGNGGGFTVGVDGWGDIIEVPAAGGIRAGTVRNAALRATVNTYATIPDFVVNGIYVEAPGSINWSYIFNEQYVYKPESGLIWDYAPKKYWPASGSIAFYAYAPAGAPGLKKGLKDNRNDTLPPVIEYAMPRKEREEPPPGTGERPSPTVIDDNVQDWLVAVQRQSSPQTAPVPMNFRHAFSRVTIKAKTDDDKNYSVKVTRADLRNVYAAGKLALAPDTLDGRPYSVGIPMEAAPGFRYGGASKVTLWTDLDSLSNYHFRLLSGAVTIEDNYTPLLNTNDGIFVIPQAADNAAVYLEYDIYSLSPAGDERYLDSQSRLQRLPDGFAFEIGRQYELQVSINAP